MNLQRIRRLSKELGEVIKKQNLFKSYPLTTNEHDLQNERISTRVFLILLIFSIIILLLYHSLININKTEIKKQPTYQQYQNLDLLYSKTLTCPCKTILINYKDILEINYTFHQICSSDFIKQNWFNYLINSYDKNKTFDRDFRWTGSFIFQGLNSLCELINQTFNDSYSKFLTNQYISTTTTSFISFQSQIQMFIQQFRLTTTYDFLHSFNLIRSTTYINSFYSERKTNSRLGTIFSFSSFLTVFPSIYSKCSCDISSKCSLPSSFYNNSDTKPLFTIPGLYQGCYIIEALLQSNLECFYNEKCLTELQLHIKSSFPINLTALSRLNESNYDVNSTIEQLINELMIEQWNPIIKYENYYNKCQPIECIYSYQTKNEKVYIITTTIGLLGGLITVLKIIIPILVKFLRKKKQISSSKDNQKEKRSCLDLIRKLIKYIKMINLFESIPPTTNEHDLQNERISTRVFIIFLFLSLIILLLYHSLININKTEIKKQPTYQQYKNLNLFYSETLTCPCKNISIDYKDILEISYTFHQICSSDFIKQNWFNYLINSASEHIFFGNDFRQTLSYKFQGLNSLCEIINQTLNDSYSKFLTNQYISTTIIPLTSFQSQIQSFIRQFRSSIRNHFLRLLYMIRSTTYINGLHPTRSDIFIFMVSAKNNRIYTKSTSSTKCNCEVSSKCVVPFTISENGSVLPGFYQGCYIIEALLQSNLECFYNQTCITELQLHIKSSFPIDLTALSRLNESNYDVNSTIEQLINELMIEQWNPIMKYENYYNKCQPIECIYSYQTKNEKVYIITTTIGLLGGLITVLKIIIPILVKFLRQKKLREIENNNTQSNSSLLSKLIHLIRTFNLFPSMPPSINEHDLRNERLSTRIFLILLLFSLGILFLYNIILLTIKTESKLTPTYKQYEDLYLIYSNTLTCPCKNILIDYKDILQINYTLHQICSSHFINESWINWITYSYLQEFIPLQDFRLSGKYLFQGLNSLCQLIDQTLAESYSEFLSNQYVSTTVTSSESFGTQIKMFIEQFQLTTINNFLHLLHMIRQTTHINALYSGLLTNYEMYVDSSKKVLSNLTFYENCRCDLSPTCRTLYPINDLHALNEKKDFIPGLYRGCYMIEALLQSNLEYFYNETYLKQLNMYFINTVDKIIPPLDSHIQSRYDKNSTIEQLVKQLMIEQWSPTTNYTNYFNQCQPVECIYNYQKNYNLISILAILIGLTGGLITVLKIFVPNSFSFLRWIIKQCKKKRIGPHISTNDHN